MLHALGFPDDKCRSSSSTAGGTSAAPKMSKSLGNVIDPDLLADKYGAEALRYYLMSDMAIGNDADFLEDRLRSVTMRIWQTR